VEVLPVAHEPIALGRHQDSLNLSADLCTLIRERSALASFLLIGKGYFEEFVITHDDRR